jgi:hypothetical protein
MRAGIATSTLLAAVISASALMVMAPIQAEDNTAAETGEIKPDTLHCGLQSDVVGADLARVGSSAYTRRQVPAAVQQTAPCIVSAVQARRWTWC